MKLARVVCFLLSLFAVDFAGAESAALGGPNEWPYVGGSIGGQRFSALTSINKNNVKQLHVAWTYHHGDFSTGDKEHGATAFQVTPIVIDGTMYFCTPYNRVIALDAETGHEKWTFDPKTNLNGVYTPTCRGVTYYRDNQAGYRDNQMGRDAQAAAGQVCKDRIFVNTVDARLLSIDAKTGKACADFGKGGAVNLLDGLGKVELGEYYPTSPPLVINNVVLTGAFIKDGQRIDAPGGAVRAYDARTGELKWVFDPVPPGMPAVTAEQLKQGATLTHGTPNVWGLMSADPARNLVFLPTGNPAPDHYRGKERGDMDYYGSSTVALDADTGAVRWHFQTVHHDLWDYDVAAQPVTYQIGDTPALVQATKVGNIFLLNRETGAPLFPVEERPVPKSDVPGERNSPTQPIPTMPAPVHPQTIARDDLWGLTPWDKHKCQEQFDTLEYRGLFTPPSFKGTLEYPGLGGGVNWASVSIDPIKNRMVLNMQVVPFIIKLAPRPKDGAASEGGDLVGINPQLGTPYIAQRGVYLSPLKTPCVPPPWGKIIAIDLKTGARLWEKPLGNLNGLAPPVIGKMLNWGTPNSGGSMQTAGGLVFIAATMDKYFRAFDADNGEELWHYELPFAGNATPMTYQVKNDGKQFVVIAAGGHGPLGTAPGDAIVAFTLGE
ncbi:MAG TPA: pyrroloquinoline quinone-dependent dehydrogenase [Spongiibacteraceae bacterium]